MVEIDFIGVLHNRTKRDYVGRVTAYDKAECAEIAKQYGADYWDGERQYGYGGYSYDGRWRVVTDAMVDHYGIKPGDRILDIGCGKGYLLYEFTQSMPGVEIAGIDISEYAIENAKEEVKPFVQVGNATTLPFEDESFDFVVSLGTLHNLRISELFQGIREMERVKKGERSYLMVESFRNERERANLLYWQLTCESFHSTEDWKWIAEQAGYSGDVGFIFFE
jgi:protein-L-isoaspartate(D-aspartate) O-methyltransferase